MAYANSRSDVSVFYANSRSLVNKIDQLELEVATYPYDQRRLIWTVLFWIVNYFLQFTRFLGVIVLKMVDKVVVF